MITYSKIGKKGHLGNQLFQIASTIGLGVKNNQDFFFLDWKYQHYFKNKLPVLELDFSDFIIVREEEYNYYERKLETNNYDVSGWLQTEKYFDENFTKHYFEFSDNLKNKIKSLYKEIFIKRTILISIRRGDFVNHPDYFQLPINYYLNSLAQFFPDWQSCNLIVLGDDIKYCKFHFSFLENAFFGDGLNDIEQLCLGSLCDDFIISNSTFSWWSAWLGEKKNSKIIRPFKNFDGLKALELSDIDYYPERWIKYNHLGHRIKLEGLAFQIEAKKNKELIEDYISSYFEAKVISNDDEVDSYNSVYLFRKDYLLPPLLIYYSWLKSNNSGNNLVVNSLIKSFKVSKALNYKEYLIQKDFGLFSTIFSFQKIKKKTRKHNYDIYLKRNNNSVVDLDKAFQSNDSVVCFFGGEFSNFEGYTYSFRRFIKTQKIQFKKSIKKILFIKKI